MKKGRLSKGIYLLPSLCTTGNLFFGFFSIIRSINGDHLTAAWAILAATVFDMMDGRVARMTKTQSEFGKEYDSLVDLASFGLAPAILVHTWVLDKFQRVGWFFAFLYFACAALRLARFNVQTETVEKKSFNGLPTPPAASLMATFVILNYFLFGTKLPRTSLTPQIALAMVPCIALLMVSSVSYRSFKEYDVKKASSIYVLMTAAVVVGLIAIRPEVMLFVGYATYVVSGPIRQLLSWVLPSKKRKDLNPKSVSKARKLSVVEMKKNPEIQHMVNHEQR